MPKIENVEYIGNYQTYDLEIDHPDHQFYLANGLLTSNSHAISYSYNSYACAWLFHYYPIEWVAAVLENESQEKPEDKQKAISLVRSFGYNVIMPKINMSTDKWQIIDDKTVIAPYSFIKGIGETAIPEIIKCQPYKSIEEFIFNDKIDYRKMNVRVIKSLILAGAMDDLKDDRFDNLAHFYYCIAENRPKTLKELEKTILASKGKIIEYTNQERFIDKSSFLGYLDIDLLISKKMQDKLSKNNVCSISEYDSDINEYCWCYVSSFEEKTSQKGNKYIILNVYGSAFDQFEILLFGSDILSMKEKKCALLKPAKVFGQGKMCVYDNNIRWIE